MADRLASPMNTEMLDIKEAEVASKKYLAEDEEVLGVFQGGRDFVIISDTRIIFVDVKGIGKKIKVTSFPLDAVASWSYESQGVGDLQSEYEFHFVNGDEFIFGTKGKPDDVVEIMNTLLV